MSIFSNECKNCCYFNAKKEIKRNLLNQLVLSTDEYGTCSCKKSSNSGKRVRYSLGCMHWKSDGLLENAKTQVERNTTSIIQSNTHQTSSNTKKVHEVKQSDSRVIKENENDERITLQKKIEYQKWYESLSEEDKKLEDEKKKQASDWYKQWLAECENNRKVEEEKIEQKRRKEQEFTKYKNQKLTFLEDFYNNALKNLKGKNKNNLSKEYSIVLNNINNSSDYTTIDDQVIYFEKYLKDLEVKQLVTSKKTRPIVLYSLGILLSILLTLVTFLTVNIVSSISLDAKYEYQYSDYMLYEKFGTLPDNITKEEFLEMYQAFVNASVEWDHLINIITLVAAIVSVLLITIFTLLFVRRLKKINKDYTLYKQTK